MAKTFFEVLFFCKINCLPVLPEEAGLFAQVLSGE
jgi:hypothetical protein